ncbi:MAG: exosortase/archaeosortase family protein [Nitrospiraceae bacterium]|nr:exosortase/archaeosortase family protein [Nitrospiraceae bacterium]
MSEPATYKEKTYPAVFFSGWKKAASLFLALAGAAIFYGPLRELIIFSFQNENYSHMPLIPFISGYFFWLKRKEISSNAGKKSWVLGALVLLASAAPYLIGKSRAGALSENDYLFFMMLSAVLFCLGCFTLLFGLRTFRAAAFPLFFLFFMVPVPAFILNKVIFFLQTGSTYGADQIFKLAGIPFLHHGFKFDFPGLSIYVAHECSGIRSSVSLVIMGVIMGQLFLERWSAKLLAFLVAVPLAILKNSIRIATLTTLSLYVDRSFMYGRLHRDGGILFFLIGLSLLGLFIRFLRRFDVHFAKRG